MARKIFIFFIPVEIGNGPWLYFAVNPLTQLSQRAQGTAVWITIAQRPSFRFTCSNGLHFMLLLSVWVAIGLLYQ